jgi:hypothetical protein
MTAPAIIDIDAAALHQLTQRRGDARLATGFVLAAGMVLELFAWDVSPEVDGCAEWRPVHHSPNVAGPDVRARVQVEDGGAVDIRAGDLCERHISFGTLMGRLLVLAKHGQGQRPRSTDHNRRLAACAVASLAGMVDDRAIDRLVDDPETIDLFFGREAA